MQQPPISQDEIHKRISAHLDELLEFWWAEQGKEKTRDLELMATVLPFPREQTLRVLDLCCGPGDVGRAIKRLYPNATIDCIDRDPFLTAICAGVNRRENIPGNIVTRDLEDVDWRAELESGYDVIATANALHWFTAARASTVLRDIHELLQRGGVFLFAEPVSPGVPFAAGFEEWKAQQPSRYSRENWERFWSKANTLLGYDHIKLLGSRNANRIGDEGITVAGWMALLGKAGFGPAEILLRDGDEVIAAAVKA